MFFEFRGMTTEMVKVKGGSAEVPIADSDRRAAPRVLVDLEVDYASEENYLFAYITDISETGIFVRTTTPEQPGTRLNLRFRLDDPSANLSGPSPNRSRVPPREAGQGREADLVAEGDRHDENSPQIEVEGVVIWINPYRPGAPDNLHPGMGIRFVALEDELKDRLLELVRRFAYLS